MGSLGVSSSAFVILYLDLRRRHYVATKLDELLRTGIYTGSQHVRSISPHSFRSRSIEWLRSISSQSSSRGGGSSGSERSSLTGQGIAIDFYNVQSLQAWWITRYLVHNFGLGFFKRIKYYTTYFACYCGVLIILIGLRLLKGIKRQDIYLLVSVVVCLDAFFTLVPETIAKPATREENSSSEESELEEGESAELPEELREDLESTAWSVGLDGLNNETLRMINVVGWVFGRTSEKDVQIKDVAIRKDWIIGLTHMFHLDQRYFHEPENFNPYRFEAWR